NAALALQRALTLRGPSPLESHQGSFGAEFTDLASQVGSRSGICVERSADYLNWRYRDHPANQFEVLTLRAGGRLRAYAVLQHEQNRTNLIDCLADQPETRDELMRGLVATLTTRSCEVLSVSTLVDHPFFRQLQGLGFRPRESSPVVFLGYWPNALQIAS